MVLQFLHVNGDKPSSSQFHMYCFVVYNYYYLVLIFHK